jgi:putative ABC transport system substrate-binding protein
MMRRRQFIIGAVAWPVVARAQQPERVRRIGVLLPAAADNEEFQTWFGAFLQALALSGWTTDRNVRIDTRWATANAVDIRRHATELAALAPDVILAHGASTVAPLLQATRTVPIVFPSLIDPVGAGFVESLARPGGNVTGFMSFEYSIGGKWLELLKEIAPSVTRAAVLRDATQGTGSSQFAAIQAVAPTLRVEVSPVNLREAGEIERAVTAFARAPNGGLILTSSAATGLYHNLIILLAARYKLPAMYHERLYVAAGGLISYGPSYIDRYRRAASYVDRILKGGRVVLAEQFSIISSMDYVFASGQCPIKVQYTCMDRHVQFEAANAPGAGDTRSAVQTRTLSRVMRAAKERPRPRMFSCLEVKLLTPRS